MSPVEAENAALRAKLAEALQFFNDKPSFGLRRDPRRTSYQMAAEIEAVLAEPKPKPKPAARIEDEAEAEFYAIQWLVEQIAAIRDQVAIDGGDNPAMMILCMMMAKNQQFLRAKAAAADWFTLHPRYRTKAHLLKMIEEA
jgi:hypothetical protein